MRAHEGRRGTGRSPLGTEDVPDLNADLEQALSPEIE